MARQDWRRLPADRETLPAASRRQLEYIQTIQRTLVTSRATEPLLLGFLRAAPPWLRAAGSYDRRLFKRPAPWTVHHHFHFTFTHTLSSLESPETRGELEKLEPSQFGGETSVSFTDAKISTILLLLWCLCIMLFFISLFYLLSCVMSE